MPRDGWIEPPGAPPPQNGNGPVAAGRVSENKAGLDSWNAAQNSKNRRQPQRPRALRLDGIIGSTGSFGASRDWSSYSDPLRNPQFSRMWSDPEPGGDGTPIHFRGAVIDRSGNRVRIRDGGSLRAATAAEAARVRAEIAAERARVLRGPR